MMIGQNDNEILQLSRESMNQICNDSAQQKLKASSDIRERMYKNHIKRYQGYTVEQIKQKQLEFSKKNNFCFDKIKELFKKSMKDNKIVTHIHMNKTDFSKNLSNFNKIIKNSGIQSTQLQGDKDDIASTVTPRLVSRSNGVNSLTPAQQLSLIALRQSGKGLRDGTRQVNSRISDIDFEKVEEEKKNLSTMNSSFLVKKNIQHLDLSSKQPENSKIEKAPEQVIEQVSQPIQLPKVEEPLDQAKKEEAKKDDDAIKKLTTMNVLGGGIKQTLHSKLETSNESLLKKLGHNIQSIDKKEDPALSKLSEFSLKTATKDRPFNSVFLKIAKEDITQQPEKPKVEDKFASQRKKLLNFGI